MSFHKKTSCSRYSTKDYKNEMENVICTSGAFPRCCDNTTMLTRVAGLLLSYKAKKKRNNNNMINYIFRFCLTTKDFNQDSLLFMIHLVHLHCTTKYLFG